MSPKLTKESFIKRAKKAHGDKRYNYSKVIYKDMITKVEIICPRSGHGSFFQRPTDHLSHGCPKCAGCRRLTTDEFITRSQKTHGDKYDYSKVNYVNTRTKVEIICETHGSFFQRPDSHLKGTRCADCVYDARRNDHSDVISAIVLY